MARLEQGENFDEAPVVDVNGQPVNAPANNNNAQGGNPPKLGPKQMAIAGVVIVLIIAIAIIMLGGKKDTDTEQAEDTLIGDTATPNSTTSDNEEVSDPFGDDLVSDPFGDDMTPIDEPQQSGQLVVDPITNPYAYSFYSDDEVYNLRGYGYTGDEIEYNAQLQTPYDDLVAKAYAAYDEKYNEWRESVLNESSDGYKNLMDKTYLGSPATKDNISAEDISTTYSYLENVDYEKCGVYNYQAWIKVHLSIGDVIISIPLTRYSQIAEEGNILITFTTAVDSEGNILYLTKCEEYQV